MNQTSICRLMLLVALISGCNKMVQVGTPPTQLSDEVVFGDDQSANAVVQGMFDRSMQPAGSFVNGGITVYCSLSADECRLNGGTMAQAQFYNNALDSKNGYISILYSSAYNDIFNANNILENLTRANKLSDSVKSGLEGETRLFRALIYYELVQLFGPVPIVTMTDGKISSAITRSPASDVFKQIMLDLRLAEKLLPVNYKSNTSNQGRKARPNKYAVDAVLARCYLYCGQYDSAILACNNVVNSGMYSMNPSLDSVFVDANTEAIWQLSTPDGQNSGESTLFFSAETPRFLTADDWVESLDSLDNRRSHWIKSAGTTYFPCKYEVKSTGTPLQPNMLARLAEIFLIRAEANARLGLVGPAIADLNIVRHRAGLPPAADMDRPSLLMAIMQERRIELYAEWGHRWFDLKRTGQAGAILHSKKNGWQGYDTLYPLPSLELQRNTNLGQNHGY